MAHDQHETATGFNVARYFVEHRHISWVLFVGVLAWGVGAYQAMPKRKDPDIPVRQVAVATPWPGQSAERVEQLVTRKIEEKIAQNIRVSEIKSRSRAGLSVVYAEVDDRVHGYGERVRRHQDQAGFSDRSAARRRAAAIHQGVRRNVSADVDRGESAEPMACSSNCSQKPWRKRSIPDRSISFCAVQEALDHSFLREAAELLSRQIRAQFQITPTLADGNGFVLITGIPAGADLPRAIARLWDGLPQRADLHPDVWDPIVIVPGASSARGAAEERGSKVFVPRTRRLHRAHRASGQRYAGSVPRDTGRAARRAGGASLLAGSHRGVWHCSRRDPGDASKSVTPRFPPAR